MSGSVRPCVSVTATLMAPLHLGAKTAGCPGSNGTARMTITSATLVISQNGQVLYSQTFTP